jgi:predicted DNA-binding ribbon-helix-helix protein
MPTSPTKPDARAKTGVIKRSLEIAGHRTSISLEDAFWTELRAIAGSRAQSVASLVAEVDASRGEANLSSALRVFVLDTIRTPRPRENANL